jgi:hypothetical protein
MYYNIIYNYECLNKSLSSALFKKKNVGMRVRAWEEGLRDVNRALSQPRKAFMTAYRWIMYIYEEHAREADERTHMWCVVCIYVYMYMYKREEHAREADERTHMYIISMSWISWCIYMYMWCVLYIYVYMYMYMYGCMYIYMYGCTYICM